MRVVKDKAAPLKKAVADVATELIREEVRREVAPQITLLKQKRDELKQMRRRLKENGAALPEQKQKLARVQDEVKALGQQGSRKSR